MLVPIFLAAALLAGSLLDAPSQRARLNDLKSSVALAEAAYSNAYAALPDPDQPNSAVDKVRSDLARTRETGFATALQVAQENPQSDEGFDALEWLLLNAPRVFNYPAGKPALELMTRFYTKDPRMGRAGAVTRVALDPPFGLQLPQDKTIPTYDQAYQAAMELLKAVAETNPDHCARGQAKLGLAFQAKRAFLYLEYIKRPAKNFRSEAERGFEEVIKDYADCPCLGDIKGPATLGERAKAELFELQNLRPGSKAPEIAGTDLSGVPFKAGDYRGKVTLLVFWASWCGPCMAEVPHERELVAHFKGRPFAIVGVNCDEDMSRATAAVSRNQISWRSFWDGPNGAYGPINTAWNIQFLPTVYVIDHEGRIVQFEPNRKDLDAELENRISAAEAAIRTAR